MHAGDRGLELTRDLTRGELLERGVALVLAASGASFVSLDQLAPEAHGAARLRKCMSLGGPGSLRVDGHPDDYLAWGNREFIRDESGTAWVKLWVSWYDLQQELGKAPAGRVQSWNHLNTAPGGQSWLRRLDRQVRAINQDGLGCILTLYQAFPTWANGATGIDPVGRRRGPEMKVPLDLSTNGPWGWFIAYLLARYKRGAAPNPTGPREPDAGESGDLTRFGNPDGAGIDALEICNEPNHLYWPQEGIAQATAQMIRSADQLSATWGPMPILAPATSDYPDSADIVNSRGIVSTAWENFTRALLKELRGFDTMLPFRWSHHNYRETRFGEAPRRSRRLAFLVHRFGRWRRESQPIWLTEGGYNMGTSWQDPAVRESQARLIEQSFRGTLGSGDVFMWTQHTISDKQGNSWKGGLRDDFAWGVGLGQPRPSWYVWRDLRGWPEP
jgi:hypothetical protein